MGLHVLAAAANTGRSSMPAGSAREHMPFAQRIVTEGPH